MRIAILLLCVSALWGANAETQFWAWVQENSEQLLSVESGDEKIAQTLAKRMTFYHKDLAVVLSTTDDKRSIVISANGIRSAIPAVNKLVEAAPAMEQWRVVAFRQAKDDLSERTLTYKKMEFKPKNIYFKTFTKDGHFDVALYYPNYLKSKHDDYVGAGFLLLDMAIGELAVMTKVRYIEHRALPDDIEDKGYYPLTDLNKHLQTFYANKEARKNKVASMVAAASIQMYNAEKPMYRRYQPGSGIKQDKNLVVVISDNQTSVFSSELQAVLVNIRAQKKKIIYVYKNENGNYVQYKP